VLTIAVVADYGVHKGGEFLAETPFRENAPRHQGLNFYYVQEDMLKEAAKKSEYHWIVSRPNFIVGQSKVSERLENTGTLR
jgi:hypothetical protein